MKLPGAGAATIDSAKVRDYLFSKSHPVGRFKASFFASLGYAPARWELLRDDLNALAREEHAVTGPRTSYGQKYEVRGSLTGPNGRSAAVVTVWIILHGESSPRFVTAFPGVKT